jgi:hypothetical protein
LTGTLVAAALVVLAIAVVVVVARVLSPTQGWSIAINELERYPTWEFISQETVMVQGRLMRGFLAALERDRARNAMKAKWLRRSYWLVCVGLGLVSGNEHGRRGQGRSRDHRNGQQGSDEAAREKPAGRPARAGASGAAASASSACESSGSRSGGGNGDPLGPCLMGPRRSRGLRQTPPEPLGKDQTSFDYPPGRVHRQEAVSRRGT